jgi:hypothetical protein
VAGTSKCGTEPSVSIESAKYLDYLRTDYLLKNEFDQWSMQVHTLVHVQLQNYIICVWLITLLLPGSGNMYSTCT